MENKLISVIIPVYNVEKLVGRCIESFLGQTYKNIELILINDGSTDESLSICRRFSEKDSRIKLLDKPNGGVSSARNAGLAVCTGELVAFADSDDYVDADYLEQLYSLIEQYNADCVCCQNSYEDEHGRSLYQSPNSDSITILENDQIDFRDSSYVAVVSKKLYRAQCLRPTGSWIEFDIGCTIAEDSYYAALVVPHISRMVKTERQMYHYVQRSSSITHSQSFMKCIKELASWKKIYEFAAELGERYERSAKYELCVHCFRAYRAVKPLTNEERAISSRILAYLRENADVLLSDDEYPLKLKLVLRLTLLFPNYFAGFSAR